MTGYRAVDGVELVVARSFAGGIVECGDALHLGRPAFPGAVAGPEFGWAGELVQREVLLQHAGGQGGVTEHKAITVAGEHEGYVQKLRVVDGLLNSCLHGKARFFDLHHRQRNIGLEE